MSTLLIGSNSRKIASVSFDTSNNSLAFTDSKDFGFRPSWIHLQRRPGGLTLITNNEADEGRVLVYDSNKSSDLFSLDSLVLRFDLPSGGADPCYLDVDLEGDTVFAANYNGGTASMRALKDGSEFRVLDFEGFKPDSPPHPHMMIMNPHEPKDSRRIYIPDLGSDCLHIVGLDVKTGVPFAKQSLKFAEKSGPRHICFHPNGTHAYVNLELSSELAVISLFPNPEICSIHSLLPPGVSPKAEMQSAAIELSPDSRFIYLSNRKDPSMNDTLVCFPILESGLVSATVGPQWTKTDGFFPRGFKISKDGNWLCVGNQETDTLVMFERNNFDGSLIKVSELKLEAGFKPTCIVWL
ncbi:Lactonase, 7-bladed beta-propeller-domain-containing protein [Obelidium mucronatum]|nr:Lactonase, 7-bladed beta-propeller-domain-containing protein [Obelidium mucronatum]